MPSTSTEVLEQQLSDITASEIMVTAASKEVQDGEIAVVGIGLPQVACVLARRTHAPVAQYCSAGGSPPSRRHTNHG